MKNIDEMSEAELDAELASLETPSSPEDIGAKTMDDIDSMSESDIDAEIARLSGTPQFDPISQPEAALISVGEGLRAFGKNVEFVVRDIGAELGLGDPKQIAKEKSSFVSEREQFKNSALAKKFPVTTTLGSVAGELAPSLLPAGAIARGVSAAAGGGVAATIAGEAVAGGALGALASTEDRAGGAVAGAALGAAGGAVIRGAAATGRAAKKGWELGANKVKSIKLTGEMRTKVDEFANTFDTAVPDTGFGGQLASSMKRVYEAKGELIGKKFQALDDIAEKKIPAFNLDKAKQVAAEQLDELDNSVVTIEKQDTLKKLFQEIIDSPLDTFKNQRQVRMAVDDKFNKFNTAAKFGNADDTQVRALSKVRKAIEEDIESATKKAGLFKQYKAAKTSYQETMLPFDEAVNAKILNSKQLDFDSLVNSLTKTDGSVTAKKIVSNLDSKGKVALKNGIIKKVYDKSVDAAGDIDSAKFMKEIKKYNEVVGLVFDSKSAETAKGLLKLQKEIAKTETFSPRVMSLLGQAGVQASYNPLHAMRLLGLATTEVGAGQMLRKAAKMKAGDPRLTEISARFVSKLVAQEGAK